MSFFNFTSDFGISPSALILMIVPVALIQFALMITALLHMLKRNKTRNLSVIAWLLIIVLINLIGPIAYFLVGRTDDYDSD